jgi:predicted nucleic-acid-binding protein
VGGGAAASVGRAGTRPSLRAFADTNVLVRHLTGDPPEQASRATDFLRDAEALVLADVIFAEAVYVLESFYELERDQVAELMRAVIGFPAIIVLDASVLLRALEVYETQRIDFAEAYLVACAEASGVGAVASFDRSIDRVATVRRVEP